jgi:hypothetical protein
LHPLQIIQIDTYKFTQITIQILPPKPRRPMTGNSEGSVAYPLLSGIMGWNGQVEAEFLSCYRKNQVTKAKTGRRMKTEYPM